MNKSSLDIKKLIIKHLKQEGELSLSQLERKINTNNETILSHTEELEFLGIIQLIKHKKSLVNGRPFTTVVLTEYGKNL